MCAWSVISCARPSPPPRHPFVRLSLLSPFPPPSPPASSLSPLFSFLLLAPLPSPPIPRSTFSMWPGIVQLKCRNCPLEFILKFVAREPFISSRCFAIYSRPDLSAPRYPPTPPVPRPAQSLPLLHADKYDTSPSPLRYIRRKYRFPPPREKIPRF